MLLFELYKVLPNHTLVLICGRTDMIIYHGYLDNLDIDFLQKRVTYLRPIANYELLIRIDI